MKTDKKDKFIKKALEIHKNENLDYSKVEYKTNRIKVCIIDHDLDENGNEYGEFWITPSNFLKGQCHPKKRGKRISLSKRSKQEEIIKRFEKIHKGEGLDYSKVEYVNMHTKVCIIDPIYGEYWQEPNVHLKGCGHPNRKKARKTLTTEEFIEKAKKIHGDTYSYEKTSYKNYREPVLITCKKHGDFWQSAENHLYGKGCPKCGNHYSKFEDELLKIISDDFIKNDRTILNGKEIDIYIPSKNIGIEFNGLKWHSDWFAGKDRNYHISKTIECEKKEIQLIQIFEDEYRTHKDLVESKLKHILKYNVELHKIYGRKCVISEISASKAKQFLIKNHIQGFARSTVYIGAFFKENLIAVMTFKKENKNENKWELNRFASDINYICVGVGGKLFNWFINTYNPSQIKSFADRRWSTTLKDNFYIKAGFKFNSFVPPDYKYISISSQRNRIHKFGFRKQILHKKYGLPLTMTETEMVKELGYDRIWDCGLIKYIWINEKP